MFYVPPDFSIWVSLKSLIMNPFIDIPLILLVFLAYQALTPPYPDFELLFYWGINRFTKVRLRTAMLISYSLAIIVLFLASIRYGKVLWLLVWYGILSTPLWAVFVSIALIGVAVCIVYCCGN